ncbi:hypothetical protein RG836_25735 [Pseudomonas sp. SZMC_28357]|uniref:DUF7683 domain-containing protein n=1 Tax=Pseudomonas sp. SZMC_28357 TaxID=3074380 RepID=UPI0028721A55|nr:hypothetical protein [Pseudomonas sp. SZMC_28357]MDR9754851.1 hypothetical protein [Pseudomonas sp. SZMC_28357]
MKHVIEVFDRQTEQLLMDVDVPADLYDDLKRLMNWHGPEDEFDVENLSPAQIQVLENWTGKSLTGETCIVQLVCLS